MPGVYFLFVERSNKLQPKEKASAWEYRTLTTDNRKGKSVLDNYGRSGWELVGWTCITKSPAGTNFEYQYIFKRPKK